jgi:transcription elongation factor Elf1
LIEYYPRCAKCEDGGDLTTTFDDKLGGWVWHCDSCGTERECTENEVEVLLGLCEPK